MTETARWIETKRRALTRLEIAGTVTLAAGLVLLAFALGAFLGRLGVYHVVPLVAFAAWVVAAVAAGWTWRRFRQRRARLSVRRLAADTERAAGLRDGAVQGIAMWREGTGSATLAAAADRRTLRRLAERGWSALEGARRGARRAAAAGGVVLAVGLVGFGAASPLHGSGADFWHPVRVMLRARGPVQLEVDRATVRRGDSVTVAVVAPGRRMATLWVRAPGERWSTRPLPLDSAGQTTLVLGPLESDRYLRASSGGRVSAIVHVDVLLPAFLADLQLVAHYPAYLDLADEELVPGDEVVIVPAGTEIATSGHATMPLARADWRGERRTVALATSGTELRGVLPIHHSGHWELSLGTVDGTPLEGSAPVLNLLAVPDSVPVVSVPVPGVDTVAPLTLRQPLVIDARDDYRLTRVEVTSWRVSRIGVRDSSVTQQVALPDGGADRAVLRALLDLNARGLLPGDTLVYRVHARDNAPTPHVGSSPTYRLRLASMAELRQATREAANAAVSRADSLARQQGDLARQLEDLAAERERGAETVSQRPGERAEQLPFESAEKAQGLMTEQEQLSQRAEALRDDVRQLAEAAWQAGITDPEFQRQLRELEQMLDRAVTDELAKRLQELKQASERLDAPAVRDALERLANEAQKLRESLERSRELFQRAALEGDLTSLAQDAEDLSQRQQDWNRQAETKDADSSLARGEQELSQRTEQLAQQLEQLQQALDSAAANTNVQPQGRQAAQASGQMQRASQAAQQRDQHGAQQAGQAASQSLDPVAQQLREQRDQMRDAWRREVASAISRAMVESAQLAKSQQQVADRLQRGESGADVRGEQAAVREGVDRVLEGIQGAAGKNALISPRLGEALGYAKNRMGEALDQLQRANPNPREASGAAGDALDALNATVYALLQTQGDVMGAQSGSGLQEALEQMAQLAEQQGGLNSETGGLMSAMPQGGEELMQRLSDLARRQRDLGDQLQKLDAQGNVTGADAMGQEAQEIARQLDAGRLDRETVQRQEQLFRRLLDAGRTLRSDEPDEHQERKSRTADPNVVKPPPATLQGPTGGPRFRYPTWEELRRLSPEQRRLILDYFRRLNGGGGGGERP